MKPGEQQKLLRTCEAKSGPGFKAGYTPSVATSRYFEAKHKGRTNVRHSQSALLPTAHAGSCEFSESMYI